MSCSKIKNVVFFWATRGTPKPNLMKQGHKNFVFFPSQMHVFDGPYTVGRGSVELQWIGKTPSQGLHGHA